ncbi:helix-turn-helix domain-containing protein [Desulfurobacterium thermolithotrophum]|uniref:helix-turn-helix domain-containing protein n=1 Tax=Desulfurobacterium thermolithotrophum TaxID=64160 RepID=UPI0013D32C7A|nr:helix-turn-helix domain-containing protein [Desulfurobacterium thermolithotrophum]
MNEQIELGKRIKQIRMSKGLTQREFADELGVSTRAVQEWEAGRRTPSEPVLRQIEVTFSVNPEWLRHGRGEMFLPREPKLGDFLKELSEEEMEVVLLALEIVRKLEKGKGIRLSPKQRVRLAKILIELLEEDEALKTIEEKIRKKAEKLIEALIV